jgi:hypothetical protein
LVALRPAFDESDRYKLMEQIRHNEPMRLKTLEPRVPHDLETIIHKSMAVDPQRRYKTAAEMGEDMERFLKDLPIKARRSSAPERVIRWCRRNPWVAASLVLLVLGAGVSAWQAVRATGAERTAPRNETAPNQR